MGLIDADLVREYGYNVEFTLESQIEKIPSFSLAVAIGFLYQNNFPDFFKPVYTQSVNAPIPPRVDEYIRSLSLEDAMHLRWGNYNTNYGQILIHYHSPLNILKFNVGAFIGLYFAHQTTHGFSIDRFIYNPIDNEVHEYVPHYSIDNYFSHGYVPGLRLKKKMSPSVDVEIVAKYSISFLGSDPIDSDAVFGFVQVGFLKTL